MNNILFIYPSWEERAFLGFKTDVEYHKIHTVYIIKKIKSLNIEKTSFYLKKIEEYCVSHNILLLYLQPIITQYFIDNKSEIWLLFLIAHSKR